MTRDAVVSVRGRVCHDDHATIRLRDWDRVYLNSEFTTGRVTFYDEPERGQASSDMLLRHADPIAGACAFVACGPGLATDIHFRPRPTTSLGSTRHEVDRRPAPASDRARSRRQEVDAESVAQS